MKQQARLVLLAAIAAVLSASVGAADKPPAHIQQAMKELWRRGTCLLSSVHKPAAKEAALPRDLGRTPVLCPRVYSRQGALLCYAIEGNMLLNPGTAYRDPVTPGSGTWTIAEERYGVPGPATL